MNIDAVIEILDEFKIQEVDGNIVFPSGRIIHTKAEIDQYISNLGLNRTSYGYPNGAMPRIYQMPQKEDDYYLVCSSVQMFKEVVGRFREQEQLPPHFIMATYGRSTFCFSAESAQLRLGRIVNYDYVCLNNLEELRAEQKVKA